MIFCIFCACFVRSVLRYFVLSEMLCKWYQLREAQYTAGVENLKEEPSISGLRSRKRNLLLDKVEEIPVFPLQLLFKKSL